MPLSRLGKARGAAPRLARLGAQRSDGSVEALANGEAAEVDAFAAACHGGPALARVTAIRREPADDGSPDFSERATV